ncbi:carboxymethylenebutenolidase [Ancylostoma caninum]|uniref:Carboxymethylenebutenolidase n=1 Tax=Ancylostoma caninum TaxID=29170 RepID=A0A368GC70_ANCCA|nr:carboxymethylenebutenolidase [Ancylostoma caninum]
MDVKSRVFEYKDTNGTTLEGVLYSPMKETESHNSPAVLVLHAFGGCSQFECGRAEALAKLGFVALAADVYGKGNRGTNVQENFALLKPFMADRTGLLKTRLLAAVEAVRKLPEVSPEMVGAIGYCFGGLCALDLARYNIGLRAAVSFHGNLSPLPETELAPTSTSVQVHHGDADVHIKTPVSEFMEEMRQREADWQFTSYGKAEHGFTEPRESPLQHEYR